MPITHYQYQDYKKRVEMQQARTKLQVEPLTRVQWVKELQQHMDEMPREEKRKDLQFHREQRAQLYTPEGLHAHERAPLHDVNIAELTGKGQFVNESV
ncbi:hypothetical protein [Pontibacillus halophilus]|nr:hypothetical protein [Pontibacillus halophilus]